MAFQILQGPSVNEALSGIFGSISLTAWICLLLPQLITNFKTKSADGLSMGFLAIWLLGDLANLSGALVTGLAPTAMVLACYFCICDLILITQCSYYNICSARRNRRQRTASTAAAGPEREPLLRRRSSSGLPSSHIRHSRHEESSLDPIKRALTGEDETPNSSPWLSNTLSILAIYIVGAAGWFVSYRIGAWDSPDGATVPDTSSPAGIGGQVLGWTSALCYLCARVPQIAKNYKEKSCEGLALLFFLFSLSGNLMYGLSVFAYSQEPKYLLKAIPWFLGSLGTIVEDCIIFYQFRIYAPKRDSQDGATNGLAHESI
ncbi:PQ-loop-domain-containing protein [Poronia punctata]|nr:PQ-loop-domain-containing protein [Poronia punctata]